MSPKHSKFKSATLTPETIEIVQNSGTETPESGKYCYTDLQGSYLCRQCGKALFKSQNKFISKCGWPSFDDCIIDSIRELLDRDGHRTEIQCNQCHAHLGHVFTGEQYTEKNIRYCVNSLALDFTESTTIITTDEAIVAGGCFWGIEHLYSNVKGVVMTESGYCGGTISNPSYETVCHGLSGHYECVRILFDPAVITYIDVLKFFFEIHNPEQINGQGHDIGTQYQSAIFPYNLEQKEDTLKVLRELEKNNILATTKIMNPCVFWPAESYHQKYLKKHPNAYCSHSYQKKFKDKD